MTGWHLIFVILTLKRPSYTCDISGTLSSAMPETPRRAAAQEKELAVNKMFLSKIVLFFSH